MTLRVCVCVCASECVWVYLYQSEKCRALRVCVVYPYLSGQGASMRARCCWERRHTDISAYAELSSHVPAFTDDPAESQGFLLHAQKHVVVR